MNERTLVSAGVQHHVPTRSVLHENAASAVDLHGLDLRNSDLRSLDLCGADLHDADLRHARTGLSFAWRARLAILSIAVSIGVGALSGLAGQRLHTLVTSEQKLERWIGFIVSAELIMFLFVALWRGLNMAVRRVLAPVCVAAIMLSVFGVVAGGTGAAGAAIMAFSALLFALIALTTLSRAVAHPTGKVLLLIVAACGAFAGELLHGGAVATIVAVSALLLSRRTRRDDPELPYLSRWSRRIVSRGGTNLRNADLRGARLEGCTLLCSDLRGAKLEGAELAGASEEMCALDPEQRLLLAVRGSASSDRQA
jgi:hypothetical protein